MNEPTLVAKTPVALSIKYRQDGSEYLEVVFKNHRFEFENHSEYVHNEDNPNIIGLTFVAINRIARAENVKFQTAEIIKTSYNQCTIRVVATDANGNSAEAVIGKNKENMPSDARADADNAAHKKACVEAFLALYGLSSARFNIESGRATVKKGSGIINMNAIDDDAPHADESNAPDEHTSPDNNESNNATCPEASTVMPFGASKGKTIFSILDENEGLKYFSRLFAVNQSIKNNNNVINAIKAYYNAKSPSDEEKELLQSIETSIGRPNFFS